jgi:chromosome partitioning protein
VGKTTLAINIAKALEDRANTVLLVDSDPQGSARDWHANSDGNILDVIALDRPTIDKDILKIHKSYDFVVIDGARDLTNMALKTVICSDVVFIPVQPSPYDVLASEDIVNLVLQRRDITEGKLKAAFIVNRQITNTILAKDIRPALERYGLPILKNGIFQRVIYADSAARGQTVFEFENKAQDEMNLLTDEILEFIRNDAT